MGYLILLKIQILKVLKDKQALDEAESRLNSLYPIDATPLVPQDTVTRINTNGVIAPSINMAENLIKSLIHSMLLKILYS